MDTAANEKLLSEVFEFWIGPELKRRQEAQQLPSQFRLSAAQVLWTVDRPVQIRLNEEIRGRAMVEPTRNDLHVGEVIYHDEIERLLDFQLLKEDGNSAHVTIMKGRVGWLAFFNFLYNAERIHQTAAAARDFIETADDARAKGRQRPFAENLFAACELTAKAWLLSWPDKETLTAKNHRFIAARVNLEAHHGNASREFVDVLNTLSRLRGNARYLHGEINLTAEEMAAMTRTVRLALEDVEAHAPKLVGQ